MVRRWFRTLVTPALSLAAIAGFGACNPDIFDVTVALGHESYPLDFGTATGAVPSAACSAGDASVCGTGQTVAVGDNAGHVTIALACDPSTNLCYAQANATALTTVDVLQDDSFISAVGRRAVSVVRMLDLQYTVPTNTTTFPVPELDVYVGPAGSTAVTDTRVSFVDKIAPLPAGTTITSPRHLTVADGSPARDLIESSIRNESAFVVLVTAAPRLDAGAALPAGKLVVDVQPVLGLGLR